jgi:hypothetical protein
MSGKRFATALKQNLDARHDFDDFLLERRTDIHNQLASAKGRRNIYILQGKIAGLDDIKNVLEQLLTPEKEPPRS